MCRTRYTVPSLLSGTESWKTLCRLRRDKIASEEKIAVLIAELAETEDSVNDRECAAQRATAAVTDLSTRLTTFRRYDGHASMYMYSVRVRGTSSTSYYRMKVDSQQMTRSRWCLLNFLWYLICHLAISGRTIVESTTWTLCFPSREGKLRW